MPESASYRFDDAQEGQAASFEAEISKQSVTAFAALSGDHSPIHTDEVYASGTSFGGTVPHGMIAGALFSRLVGMHLPGRYCLYISQTLQFHRPLPFGGVRVKGIVTAKSEATRTLRISTSVEDAEGTVFVRGEAIVRMFQ
ncbi:MAG TPA: MaoC family dehydratase [Candidatus Paceibacterota bacterium]|jgi:3-hydroxybutyryl-CoA dehydratase|nr:MaoC family dehydratase [Candidatus Paceibacterota bacterium]